MLCLCSCSCWGWACQGPKHVEDSNVTYMLLVNCALKLVQEVILYYDARSEKHQIIILCFHLCLVLMNISIWKQCYHLSANKQSAVKYNILILSLYTVSHVHFQNGRSAILAILNVSVNNCHTFFSTTAMVCKIFLSRYLINTSENVKPEQLWKKISSVTTLRIC